MSGPKSAEWYVYENLLRIERARNQAWDQSIDLSNRLHEVIGRIRITESRYSGFPDITITPLTTPSRNCSLDEIESYASKLRSQIKTLEAELNSTVLMMETQLLMKEITEFSGANHISDEELFSLPEARKTDEAPLQQQTKNRRKEQEAELLRVVERLTGSVIQDERVAIQQVTSEVFNTKELGHRETLILEIRRRVQAANKHAEELNKSTEDAAQLRLQLRGLEGAQVASIDHELKMVERRERPLTSELIDRVNRIAKEAGNEADRAYTAQVVREELHKLGYQVDEGFDTLFVKGGQLMLQKAELKEYSVEMRIAPNDQNMDVNLVRSGIAHATVSRQQALRDREMEERHCQDFSKLLLAMQERKISGRVVQRVPIGQEPVKVIEDEAVKRRQRAEIADHLKRRIT